MSITGEGDWGHGRRGMEELVCEQKTGTACRAPSDGSVEVSDARSKKEGREREAGAEARGVSEYFAGVGLFGVGESGDAVRGGDGAELRRDALCDARAGAY